MLYRIVFLVGILCLSFLFVQSVEKLNYLHTKNAKLEISKSTKKIGQQSSKKRLFSDKVTSSADLLQLAKKIQFNCQQQTGITLLSHDNKTGEKQLLCKCRFPTLVSQMSIYDDCNINVGCNPPYGTLVYTENPTEGHCVSNVFDMVGRRDSQGWPILQYKTYAEMSSTDDETMHHNLPLKQRLSLTARRIGGVSTQEIDTNSKDSKHRFSHFKMLPFTDRILKNPCLFDFYTGKLLKANTAVLVESKDYVFCSVNKYPSNHVSITTATSVLRNNYSRMFSKNAVLKIDEVTKNVAVFRIENNMRIVYGTLFYTKNNHFLLNSKVFVIWHEMPYDHAAPVWSEFCVVEHSIVTEFNILTETSYYVSKKRHLVSMYNYKTETRPYWEGWVDKYVNILTENDHYKTVSVQSLQNFIYLAVEKNNTLHFNKLSNKCGIFVVDFEKKTITDILYYDSNITIPNYKYNWKDQRLHTFDLSNSSAWMD